MSEYDEYLEGWRNRLALRREAGARRAERMREIASQCAAHLAQHYDVEAVYLFGSLAGGRTIHERSDIDLAVAGLPAKRYFSALKELWSFLPPDAELDLVPLEDARPPLREIILREGNLLYERQRLSPAQD
ncbi:nucleotidyltransferase domain-containing protein [bacterium]|nr:nucleotidyltransferase domain-containing protein [bacterium]